MSAKLRNVPSTGVFVACIAIVGLTIGCDRKGDMSSDRGRASYAIGMQIGNSLKQQNADIDPDALSTGLKDALAGQQPRLKPEELQAAMTKMNEAAQKKQSEEADKNAKAGDEWLEKNKSKANVKTTPSGLQYEVVTDGTGATPKDGDTVKVHYTGTLTNGSKFDSSVDRGQPVEIPVNGVIPGWTEALKMMKAGSKWKLYIPAKLAYGPQTRPGIPANSVLLFDVELIDVKPGTGAAGQPGAAPGGEKGKAPKGKKK